MVLDAPMMWGQRLHDLCVFELDIPIRHALRGVSEQRLVVLATALCISCRLSSDLVESSVFYSGSRAHFDPLAAQHEVLSEWCVIYVAKFENAVYVLHAFQKKTQRTRKEDIDLAARRYRQIGD
jgi:hypothetical protein